MKLVSIDEVDIKEKRVLIRTDFNTPLTKSGEIADDTRILAALPTIEYALKEKARVIIASHFGRPGGKLNPKLTLNPVGRKLSEILNCEVIFPNDCIGDGVKKLAGDLYPGGVMLLENLRFHRGEEDNDTRFAKRLAEIADIYVNEAFSVSHRLHASVVGILDYIEAACIGLRFKKEMENLTRLIENAEHPFVAIFGGRSASEKIPIMESFLDRVDTMLIGGVVSNTFLKALGKEVGRSVVDQIALYSAAKLISSASVRDIRVVLSEDAVLIRGDLSNYSNSFIGSYGEFPKDATSVDIGPKTMSDFALRISKAKTIFWNGPLGVYEAEDFRKGTIEIAKAISQSGAFSLAVGWDTVIAIKKEESSSGISYLSIGGKAALEFIQGKKLPALEALRKKLK
ncbi:MAG: phosphoglycerate kinase [Candidatus Dadabacteria bacterium]|nr:phosphoglycerate kinase [Candidatus Dadabacteria bacterium]